MMACELTLKLYHLAYLDVLVSFPCPKRSCRQIIKPQPRAATQVTYLYIQEGSSKRFADNRAALDRDHRLLARDPGWRGGRTGRDRRG